MYNGVEIEIYKKSSIIGCYKQYTGTVIFEPKQMLGILDLRSLGYYKLHQCLSRYYHFESAEKLCEEFNTIVYELKKDEKISDNEKYPWLEDSYERQYMTDREILDKYIDLDNSCLTESEKERSNSYHL